MIQTIGKEFPFTNLREFISDITVCIRKRFAMLCLDQKIVRQFLFTALQNYFLFFFVS